MSNRLGRLEAFNSSIKRNETARTPVQIRERVKANGTSVTKVALAIPKQINTKAQRIHSPIYLFFLYLCL
ncbi:MAG: hypothetical protein ACKVIB_11235 [Pseudomonadales bacterium]